MRIITEEEVTKILKENYEYNRNGTVNSGCHNEVHIPHLKKNFYYRRRNHGNLSHVDLRNINLFSIANSISRSHFDIFYGCNFEGSIMRGMNCRSIWFCKCNFTNADLRNSDFESCEFGFSIMKNALVDGSSFADANLSRVIDPPDFPMACPMEEEFIGYKACYTNAFNGNKTYKDLVIVKLLIPARAKRSSGTSSKCRASEAEVLEFIPSEIDGKHISYVVSAHDRSFIYKIGKTVTPKKPFDDNRYNECTSGIHFYMSKNEAIRYAKQCSATLI